MIAIMDIGLKLQYATCFTLNKSTNIPQLYPGIFLTLAGYFPRFSETLSDFFPTKYIGGEWNLDCGAHRIEKLHFKMCQSSTMCKF